MANTRIIRPSTYILLDSRRERKDKRRPVRLVVKYQNKMRVWGLNLYLTDVEYRHTQKPSISAKLPENKRADLQRAKEIIESTIDAARRIILGMSDFSFDEFDKKMFPKSKETLFTALEKKYNDLVGAGRAGYGSTYLCTLNAFKMYRGGEKKREGYRVQTVGGRDIRLSEVNISFLNSFEKWFIGMGNSPTSVGIYLRNVRVIMIEAFESGLISSIPFGTKKFEIPNSIDRKLALTIEDIGKIQYAGIREMSTDDKYRDFWMFLYYAGGMNVKDMARLKYKNISVDEITYVRAKTIWKKKKRITKIVIPLNKDAARIIDKWGNKPIHPEKFVFPILCYGIGPMTERRMVVDETAKINRVIKRVAQTLELGVAPSTYTARHSFATILKRSGVPVSAISDFLGHSDTKTTENYLAGFEKKAKEKLWENLNPAKGL